MENPFFASTQNPAMLSVPSGGSRTNRPFANMDSANYYGNEVEIPVNQQESYEAFMQNVNEGRVNRQNNFSNYNNPRQQQFSNASDGNDYYSDQNFNIDYSDPENQAIMEIFGGSGRTNFAAPPQENNGIQFSQQRIYDREETEEELLDSFRSGLWAAEDAGLEGVEIIPEQAPVYFSDGSNAIEILPPQCDAKGRMISDWRAIDHRETQNSKQSNFAAVPAQTPQNQIPANPLQASPQAASQPVQVQQVQQNQVSSEIQSLRNQVAALKAENANLKKVISSYNVTISRLQQKSVPQQQPQQPSQAPAKKTRVGDVLGKGRK